MSLGVLRFSFGLKRRFLSLSKFVLITIAYMILVLSQYILLGLDISFSYFSLMITKLIN